MATGRVGIGESAMQVSGLKLVKDNAQTPQNVKDFIDSLKTSLDTLVGIGATVKSNPATICGEVAPGTDPRTCCRFDVTQFQTFGQRDGEISFFIIVGNVTVKALGSLKVTIPPVQTYTYADKCKPPLCQDDILRVDLKFEVEIKISFTVVGSAVADFLTFFGAGWEFKYSWSDAVAVPVQCG